MQFSKICYLFFLSISKQKLSNYGVIIDGIGLFNFKKHIELKSDLRKKKLPF